MGVWGTGDSRGRDWDGKRGDFHSLETSCGILGPREE